MIKKKIKKINLECDCPMCTNGEMKPGVAYMCKKSKAIMGLTITHTINGTSYPFSY
jgi:hypothetical protein